MIRQILAENARRTALRALEPDPIAGYETADSAEERVPYVFMGTTYRLPASMLSDPALAVATSEDAFTRLRFRYDFPFWAATCVKITDKLTSADIPFRLNRPQRRLVVALERMRLAARPIRLIMLKARQWGGSTLLQTYFAWFQIVHRRGWNSLICAHVKDIAGVIRGMYSKLLAHYPEAYWPEETKPEFRPYERMNNIRYIPGRDCLVTVCSSENQDATRGQHVSMVHLSEVAFWKDTEQHNPVDLLRSVASGVADVPYTIVAIESTANGVGNFFHSEWLRAERGESDKEPFFVPWSEIDIYTAPVHDPEALWESLDDYERWLWDEKGCTLGQIAWYRAKARSHPDRRSMMAEFPTIPSEAFSATSRAVFGAADVERLRLACSDGERGEVEGAWACDPVCSPGAAVRFVPSPRGLLTVWEHPRPGHEYIVTVDIGGRSAAADWSVICVMRRAAVPEVVAQWRGHIDHDLLARRAAAIGRYYGDALLVVESNTWDTLSEGHGQYILESLRLSYPRLYYRDDEYEKPGFHTNVSTKAAAIAHLVRCVREGLYVERSHLACNELLSYELRQNGSYGARPGCHDDILMTRAIALWIDLQSGPAPEPFYMTPQVFQALLRGGRP